MRSPPRRRKWSCRSARFPRHGAAPAAVRCRFAPMPAQAMNPIIPVPASVRPRPGTLTLAGEVVAGRARGRRRLPVRRRAVRPFGAAAYRPHVSGHRLEPRTDRPDAGGRGPAGGVRALGPRGRDRDPRLPPQRRVLRPAEPGAVAAAAREHGGAALPGDQGSAPILLAGVPAGQCQTLLHHAGGARPHRCAGTLQAESSPLAPRRRPGLAARDRRPTPSWPTGSAIPRTRCARSSRSPPRAASQWCRRSRCRGTRRRS